MFWVFGKFFFIILIYNKKNEMGNKQNHEQKLIRSND